LNSTLYMLEHIYQLLNGSYIGIPSLHHHQEVFTVKGALKQLTAPKVYAHGYMYFHVVT